MVSEMSIMSVVIFAIVFGTGRIILHIRYNTGDKSIKTLTKHVEEKANYGGK